jgi:hypothetical protein
VLSAARQRAATGDARRAAAPLTRLYPAALRCAALTRRAPRRAEIHGTRTKDGGVLHIKVPSSGYDSSNKAAHVPVTLLCSSAACRNGVVNNGFLLGAYNSDGAAVGTFDALPAGATRLRLR